jgi:hypothetical protein
MGAMPRSRKHAKRMSEINRDCDVRRCLRLPWMESFSFGALDMLLPR